jgi:hypothetical protein
MSDNTFLVLDCESGGIGDISLLSAHFAVCDSDWNVADELSLLLKPKEVDETGSTIYKVTAAALDINKINLIEHDKIAVTKAAAGMQLREFLWKYKPREGWLLPVGKNVWGDVAWTHEHILGKGEWSKSVSHKLYELNAVLKYLKRKGKIDPTAPESLEELAKFIGFDFVAHTADGDVHATIAVMKWLETL